MMPLFTSTKRIILRSSSHSPKKERHGSSSSGRRSSHRKQHSAPQLISSQHRQHPEELPIRNRPPTATATAETHPESDDLPIGLSSTQRVSSGSVSSGRTGGGGEAGLKVLFLSSDTGGGHRASAQSLADQFLHLYPNSTYQLLDIMSECGPLPYSNLTTWYKHLSAHPNQWNLVYKVSNTVAYSTMQDVHLKLASEKSVRKRIQQINPDVVVSVHPLMTSLPCLACRKLSAETGKHVPIFTVVTDLGSAHGSWFDRNVEKIFLASDAIRTLAIKQGKVPETKIVRSGLPIRHEFALESRMLGDRMSVRGLEYQRMVRKKLNLNDTEGHKVLLLMGGGEGVGSLSNIVNALYVALTKDNIVGLNVTILVVCGRNETLKTELERKDWNKVLMDAISEEEKQRFTERMANRLQRLVNKEDLERLAGATSAVERMKILKGLMTTSSSKGGGKTSSLVYKEMSPHSRAVERTMSSLSIAASSSSVEEEDHTVEAAAAALLTAKGEEEDVVVKESNNGGGNSSFDVDEEMCADFCGVGGGGGGRLGGESIVGGGNNNGTESIEMTTFLGPESETTHDDDDDDEYNHHDPNNLHHQSSFMSGEDAAAAATGGGGRSRRQKKGVVTVKPLGYTTQMASYMVASDILLTKAGPGTIAEAAAVGLPVILTSFLPGQEEGNIEFVIENGFGLYISDTSPKKIANTVSSWLTEEQQRPDEETNDDDEEKEEKEEKEGGEEEEGKEKKTKTKKKTKLDVMSEKARAAGRPDAAEEIVRCIGTSALRWREHNEQHQLHERQQQQQEHHQPANSATATSSAAVAATTNAAEEKKEEEDEEEKSDEGTTKHVGWKSRRVREISKVDSNELAGDDAEEEDYHPGEDEVPPGWGAYGVYLSRLR